MDKVKVEVEVMAASEEQWLRKVRDKYRTLRLYHSAYNEETEEYEDIAVDGWEPESPEFEDCEQVEYVVPEDMTTFVNECKTMLKDRVTSISYEDDICYGTYARVFLDMINDCPDMFNGLIGLDVCNHSMATHFGYIYFTTFELNDDRYVSFSSVGGGGCIP
jgi:hypothetical protein